MHKIIIEICHIGIFLIMDLSELKYKISKFVFFIGSFKYKRNKNLYVSFFLIAVLISATAFGVYLYQKNVITKKENILKSYFEEIKGKNSSDNAGSNNEENSGNKSGAASGNTSAGTTTVIAGTNTDQKTAGSTDKKEVGDNQPGSDTVATGTDAGADNGVSSEITTGDTVIKIKAYICGYVKNPGVYELEDDARIEQLLKACGGASEKACLEAVNLAKKLSDGEMVYIPSIEEVAKNGSFFDYISGFTQDTISDGDSSDSQSKIININIASAGELESLPGIGEVIAQDIVSYRETFGLFKSKEELKNVKGIGDIKFEKIKELISI
jgi:competence protein ComEA